MMKKLYALAWLTVLAGCLFAQESRPTIALLPFAANGVGKEESRTIENLVQSYITELDRYRSISTIDRDKILLELDYSASNTADTKKIGRLLKADLLLSGSVGVVGDNRVLTLELINAESGEKGSYSSIHSGMSDLALGARTLVRRILNEPNLESRTDAFDSPDEMREEKIVGTWRGDKGVELVRLYRSGTGLAILSSGVQMELSYSISGELLKVRQTSRNADRYYHPVPYAVAQQLVAQARPMEWTFRLYAGGSLLRGTKRSTAVRYEGNTILEIMHGSEREAEWTKMTR